MDRALASIVAWWGSVGVDVPEIKLAPRRAVRPAAKRAAPPAAPPRSVPAAPPAPPPSSEVARAAKTLDDLRLAITEFDAGDMSDHARQAVFARGNPKADIMVIGECPGREEDIQGKPFVGKTGQFLDKIFASIGLSEDDLYITTVVNWRPSGGQNPSPDEVDLCKPFIRRHIELFEPKLIVLVGGLSLAALTESTGIMKKRGQWTTLSVSGKDIPALPVYHPAFLLRQPVLKKDAWRDMLSLRERLGSAD